MKSMNLTEFAPAFLLLLLAIPHYTEAKEAQVLPIYIELESDHQDEVCNITSELLFIEPKKDFLKEDSVVHLTLEEFSYKSGDTFLLGEQTIVLSENDIFSEYDKSALISVDWSGIAESISFYNFFNQGLEIEACAEVLVLRDDRSSPFQNAAVKSLDDVASLVLAGDKAAAIDELQDFRERLDGCGEASDKNDWIGNCDDQALIREYIGILTNNLAN